MAIIFALTALLGTTGANAQAIGEGQEYAQCVADSDTWLADRCGDPPGSGMISLRGPRSQNVVVYCYDHIVIFTAAPDGMSNIFLSGGSALEIRCDLPAIYAVLPGYQHEINVNPLEGWTIDPRAPNEASICQNGELMTVIGEGNNAVPHVTRSIGNGFCSRA